MNPGQFMQFPGANTLRVGDSFARTTLSTISGALRGITHDGTQFVAVGNGGLVMTSVDGVAWTQVTTNISSVNLLSVVFGNGIYVATSISSANVYSSTDLATWTLRQSTADVSRVIFGGGVFVVHGPSIYSSTNGTSWTLRTKPDVLAEYQFGFWANNYFVLCDQGPWQNIPFAISSDGATWTGDNLIGSSGVLSSAAGVGYWGNRFVITVNRSSGVSPNRIYVFNSNPASGYTFATRSFTQQLGVPVGLPDRLVIMQNLGSISTLINANPSDSSTWGLSAFDTIPSGGNVPAVYANDIIVGAGGSTNPVIVRSSKY